jgi:diguanylate cyclase (GGDEF)-like protein
MSSALTKPDPSKHAPDASGPTAHANGDAVPAPVPTEDLTRLLTELIQIGIALTSERDLEVLLERIVAEARRITRAEAGTLFLREGDELRFAVVQNDALARRIGERAMKRQFQAEPVRLDRPSLAGHVVQTGHAMNLPDVYDLPDDSPHRFNWRYDAKCAYRTRSVLAVPLQEPSGWVLGALELINALDAGGEVVPFDARYESLIHALASQAAVAIRNTRLEELSFKDPLTDVYNRRYFKLRLEEEARRHVRFEQPLSLVFLDLDYFKDVNDEHGHAAGDQVLREVAQLLVNQSRSFTIVTRYGGDEFAILLANTPRAGAVTYGQRMRGVLERYPFHYGRITASAGVATLPDDAQTPDALVAAADRALYEAKRIGRNSVSSA